MHWIGAQFCVCMFLDSKDKSLKMLKFCQNDQRKVKNKRRTKGANGIRIQCTKCTVWPCNDLFIFNFHAGLDSQLDSFNVLELGWLENIIKYSSPYVRKSQILNLLPILQTCTEGEKRIFFKTLEIR